MKIKLIFFFLIAFIACETSSDSKIPQEDLKVKIPKFDANSAYAFVEKQVSFGGRYMNTPAHEETKNWLIAQLKLFGFEVITQVFEATAYDGKTLNGTNIIGRYKPEVMERLLLCAHYDTRHIADKDTIDQEQPIMGADDGGSGVGVLLEIARQIKNNPIPMGLDIVFFDAEDYGAEAAGNDYSWGLGSQYWSKNLHEKNYSPKYGILLDMVGSSNATFPKEGYSMKTAGKHVNKIWKLAQEMGHGKHFVNRKAGYYTDDHRFIVENTSIPMIDIINVKKDGKFGHYHHTHADDIGIIDKRTLGIVGQVMLATIYRESNKDKF